MDRAGDSRRLILVVGAAAARLAPNADPVRSLAWRPAECLRPASSVEEAYRVEIGRQAFRTPVLLGGQAARAGLSCDSCHRAGRDHPAFHFPGVSGAPGSADVTSSVLSSHRGDRVDNPVPIPDLSGPRDRLKVSQSPEQRALEAFVHGLVVEEFDGPDPGSAVLDGLAAYVRHLDPAACPRPAAVRETAEGRLDEARRAVRTAAQAWRRNEREAAILMAAAARADLGRLHERYADPALEPERTALIEADGQLASIQARLRAGDPGSGEAMRAWLGRSLRLGPILGRREDRSLFNPKRLVD